MMGLTTSGLVCNDVPNDTPHLHTWIRQSMITLTKTPAYVAICLSIFIVHTLRDQIRLDIVAINISSFDIRHIASAYLGGEMRNNSNDVGS